MGGHVDRYAGDVDTEIRAVVEVEAADEVLVGLAAPGMLGGDDAGGRLEELARAQNRPPGEVEAAGRALVGRDRDAGQLVGALADVYLVIDEERLRCLFSLSVRCRILGRSLELGIGVELEIGRLAAGSGEHQREQNGSYRGHGESSLLASYSDGRGATSREIETL